MNLHLVEFIHILTVFYHLPRSLVLFTPLLLYPCEFALAEPNYNRLICLKKIFLKNGYLEELINKCFKKFMDNIRVVKETTLTVEKKPLVPVLQYPGPISLQTRTKLKKSLKTFLVVVNCKYCLRIRLH